MTSNNILYQDKILVAFGLILVSAFLGVKCEGQAIDSVVEKDLPIEVDNQLHKLASAMQRVYLEVSELHPNYSEPITNTVYFEGNHFYAHKHYLTERNKKFEPHDHETAFDGSKFYFGDIGTTLSRPANLTVFAVADETDPDRVKPLIELPYLNAAGFHVPERIIELSQFPSLEPLVVYYLKQSVSTTVENKNGKLQIKVRVPDATLLAARAMDLDKRREELKRSLNTPEFNDKLIKGYERLRSMTPEKIVTFVLDPKYGYGTVSREEQTADGKRIVDIKSEEWVNQDVGIWLPGRCVVSWFTSRLEYEPFSDVPIFTTEFLLKRADFSQRDIAFVLDYKKAGTSIADRTTSEARASALHQINYTKAADGRTLRLSAGGISPEMRHTLRYGWIVVFILLSGFPVYIFWRKMKIRN
jgi:hypothetical protein